MKFGLGWGRREFFGECRVGQDPPPSNSSRWRFNFSWEAQMRSALKYMVAAVLLVFGFFSSAQAQERHVVPAAAVQATVQRGSGQNADRAKVQEFLARPEVQKAAQDAGLGNLDAESTVAALDDASARTVASRIDAANLAGGDQVVIISTTAIIIGLLILIIILVA